MLQWTDSKKPIQSLLRNWTSKVIILDMRISAKETDAVLDEKEKKKAGRIAQMMAGFYVGGDTFSDNESKIR